MPVGKFSTTPCARSSRHFADRRADLRRARREVGDRLTAERGLRLKHPEARILSCHGHLDTLGYRITRKGLMARPRALHRMRRRIELEMEDRGIVDIEQSVKASAGIVLF